MSSRNGGHSLNGGAPNGRKLKIVWVSDVIWQSSGYAVTTKHLLTRMAQDGHEVYNYAPGALHGGMTKVDGITVLSSNYGDDRWGNSTLAYHLNWIKPDLLITWLDPQGLIMYGWDETPVYMWLPVDTWPIPKQEEAIYGRAQKLMVCSKWGQSVLEEQGITAEYIPCGLDLDLYKIDPEGRERWRKQLRPEITEDTFLIGSVGLNTGSPDRKGYGYEFDVINEFSKRHKDVRVYIHTNAEGDGGAINLLTLRQEMGLEDVVCFNRPSMPLGETDLYMRDMYNAFDVLLHCGIAEGFGLPVIEAQACGTPVVLNACTSMTELVGYGSYGAEPMGDFIAATCSRVALPSVATLLEALEKRYDDWKEGRTNREAVRSNAHRFEQDRIYDQQWRPLLENVPEPVDFKAGERKLAIATGGRAFDGFTHHDREKLWPHIDVAHDLEIFPYPWEDDSWDYIHASDIMEHLRADIIPVMDELWRIMAPGGYLYIHTAEAGSWQLNMDPTHTQGFMLQSFDYFDPDTRHGTEYSYSEKKWKVVRRTEDAAGLHFMLQVRKEPVKVKVPRKKEVAVA